MDQKAHKIMLSKVLLWLYKNQKIAPNLWFKWWTCAMFFYDLPRLSVDLDFDFLWDNHLFFISLITKTLKAFGKIDDFNDKFYTLFYELNYGFWQKNMKIEITKRAPSGEFVLRNFLGENILVMKEEDLFTNKLVALLHRKAVTNRDIFDIRFFLQKSVSVNESLLEKHVKKSSKQYLQEVYDFIQHYDFRNILYWLGELIDAKQKIFAKTKMKDQILWFLKFYLS